MNEKMFSAKPYHDYDKLEAEERRDGDINIEVVHGDEEAWVRLSRHEARKLALWLMAHSTRLDMVED